MQNQTNINELADFLLESFFDGAVNLETNKIKGPSPLDEINWDEPDLQHVSSRCMTPQAVKDFFNSEINRSKKGGASNGFKASLNMPRITKNIILGDSGTMDINEFIKVLTRPPKTIFDKGEKSLHSVDSNSVTINTGIPALRGIVWDQEHNEFRIVNTCPGAGKCAMDCYALQGHYIFNDGKSVKLMQRLQYIFQNPQSYLYQGFREAELFAFQAQQDGKHLEIRWNDAGDFFSERYLKLALDITKQLLEKKYQVKSYFYTKVGRMVELGEKLGFTVTFSQGGIQKAPNASKRSIIVPKNFLIPFLTPTNGRGFEKDKNGKSKFRNDTSKEGLRKFIFKEYHNNPNHPDSDKITLDNIKFTDELPANQEESGKFNVIVLPSGDTDFPAQRKDVRYIFLLQH